MFIDFACIVLLIFAVFKGLRNGLVVGLFSFFGLLVGLLAALKFSTVVAIYLGNQTSISQRWLPFFAFALVFILVAFLVRLAAKAIEGILRVAMLGWLNRIGGIFLYLLIYLFIFSIVLFYIGQLNIVKKETLAGSITYPYLYSLGPKMLNGLGNFLPWFKDMFHQLEVFFERTDR